MFRNLQRWAFERNKLFKQLTKIQIERVIEAMKLQNYQAESRIYQKGTLGSQKIIVVLEGSVKKVNSRS